MYFSMTQLYQHRRHEASCCQPEHIWPLGPIPIHRDNFYTLHPYLQLKDFPVKIKKVKEKTTQTKIQEPILSR